MKVLVTGSNGQLGSALKEVFDGKFVDVAELDITDSDAVSSFDASGFDAIINAAAFTNVDGAELPENESTLWRVNVSGVGNLALLAKRNNIPFVHISTDYVFDGTKSGEYSEDVTPKPLSMYGQTKWLSEAAAKEAGNAYILRTSWVIGEGNNFVRTMLKLGQDHSSLSIVNDQIGRPTFTPTLVAAIEHLLSSKAEYGTYNVSNSGDPVSWADFAKAIFSIAKMDVDVEGVSTEEYFKDKPHATRPANSVFNLAKSEATGLDLPDWQAELEKYISKELDR